VTPVCPGLWSAALKKNQTGQQNGNALGNAQGTGIQALNKLEISAHRQQKHTTEEAQKKPDPRIKS